MNTKNHWVLDVAFISFVLYYVIGVWEVLFNDMRNSLHQIAVFVWDVWYWDIVFVFVDVAMDYYSVFVLHTQFLNSCNLGQGDMSPADPLEHLFWFCIGTVSALRVVLSLRLIHMPHFSSIR